jgi:hypothetical protein
MKYIITFLIYGIILWTTNSIIEYLFIINEILNNNNIWVRGFILLSMFIVYFRLCWIIIHKYTLKESS